MSKVASFILVTNLSPYNALFHTSELQMFYIAQMFKAAILFQTN